MDERIKTTFCKYLTDSLEQIIISKSSAPDIMTKVKLRPVELRGKLAFQVTEYVGTQVFHKNYTANELLDRLPTYFEGLFSQAELKAAESSAVVLISKKGTVTIKEKKKPIAANAATSSAGATRTGKTSTAANVAGLSATTVAKKAEAKKSGEKGAETKEPEVKVAGTKEPEAKKIEDGRITGSLPLNLLSHNREKNYIIKEGTKAPFMVDLGVMTESGKVVTRYYDKFRQINRYLEFIEDVLPALPKDREVRIIDFGCGKSYLTFAMYYYLHELKGYNISVTGLDLKKDVIKNCEELAKRYGYDKLRFLHGDIADYECGGNVDMVVTLHACDTATDYALAKAVWWGARVILCVPCCQHEVNKQIKNDMLKPVLKYGLIKERMSALITDAVRANILEEHGYRTQIMEFIDMEHTPKNILIRGILNDEAQGAKRSCSSDAAGVTQRKKTANAEQTYRQLLQKLHLHQTFDELMKLQGEGAGD